MKATIASNEIAVTYSERPEVGRDFLKFDVPNGWSDIRKLHKKVLIYNGRRFTFSGWDSDTLKCYFVAPHQSGQVVATIE